MRIAYVCYWNHSADGVARKVVAQVDRWRGAGHDAEVFCLTRGEGIPGSRRFVVSSAADRPRRTIELDGAVARSRPDLVYLRYDLLVPPPLRLLRLPLVVELNSDDRAEWRLRGRLPAAYNEVQRQLLLRSASGLVCVTHELAAAVAGFGKPTEVIGNGVDLAAAHPTPPPPRGDRPRVVFVGTPGQPWQGVDKLERLAALLPEVDVDLVGTGRDALSAPPPNLTAHGWLERDAYRDLLARADAGVGPLALHRKRMSEACALKVREYLAAGLPVLLGGEDTDFVGADPWFLLRLANTERNVEDAVPAIRAFLERVRGRRVERAELGPIDAEAKEARRLAFLERIAQASSAAS